MRSLRGTARSYRAIGSRAWSRRWRHSMLPEAGRPPSSLARTKRFSRSWLPTGVRQRANRHRARARRCGRGFSYKHKFLAGLSRRAHSMIAATEDARTPHDDPGLAALVLIAQFHGIAADAEQLRHAAASISAQLDPQELELAARSLGLKVRRVRIAPERLAKTPFPALVLDEAGRHFILAGCEGPQALVLEAGAAHPSVVDSESVIGR